MVLYLDTETSGYYPGEICQLSYVMQDRNGVKAKNFFFAVKKVEYGAYLVHGFSKEKLYELSKGKTFSDRAEEIAADFAAADLIVTHNVAFDFMFLRREFERAGIGFSVKDSFCTMKSTVGLCRLARQGGGYKYPKLSELCDKLGVGERAIAQATAELFGENLYYHDARFDTAAVYLIANAGRENYPAFSKVENCL